MAAYDCRYRFVGCVYTYKMMICMYSRSVYLYISVVGIYSEKASRGKHGPRKPV